MGCGACWDETHREKGEVARGGWADVARRLPAISSAPQLLLILGTVSSIAVNVTNIVLFRREVKAMDEIYRDIYSRIYDSVQPERNQERELNTYWRDQSLDSPLDAGTIRLMIDEAEREAYRNRGERLLTRVPPERLRPDAKVFLLINLLQMVAVPVQLSQRGRNIDLRRVLFADTVTLLRSAEDEATGNEVSSHAVLKAVAKNWQKLNLSGLKLWED
jgi:hypothetical protein